MKTPLAAALLLLAACPRVRAQDCQTTKRRACLDQAFTQCRTNDPTSDCVSQRLRACIQSIQCAPPSPPPPPPPPPPTGGGGGQQQAPVINYGTTCNSYRNVLINEVNDKIARLKDCFKYGYVRPDIASKMLAALGKGVPVRCDEIPNSRFCAATTLGGDVLISPSKTLTDGGICYPERASFLMHEVGHLASLQVDPAHNESGENYDAADEIYTLQRYCFMPARMWIGRSKRTGDVVSADKLQCMRCYQERTPSTLDDPFWKPIKAAVDQGKDPCPCAPPLNP